jgi:creatinine amidohydrolase/Fe(II)-dependent formamide hydrolase-like protein
MMYLGGDEWVRKDLIQTAVRTAGNGIIGDARRSSAELGKRAFDMKVDYAVKQIRELVGTTPSARRPQP